MLAKDPRAGNTAAAPDVARARAPGQVTRTRSLASTPPVGDSSTVPVAYLAGTGNAAGETGDGASASVGVIDAEAELISILARLEFMGTFVDVGRDRAAIIDELGQLRARLDAIAPGLAPARRTLALDRLHATEDVVLAGLQARVVGAAEDEEQAGVDEGSTTGRDRVVDYAHDIGWGGNSVEQSHGEVIYHYTDENTQLPATAEFQWCGAFAGSRYVETGGLDPELARAFSSAPSLARFFEYDWGGRNPHYIEVDGAWRSVDEYHAARGSERRWWSTAAIDAILAGEGPAGLPIRPGDIVIFNWDGDEADHIGMVQSWDGTTLRTIEGNTARLDGSSSAAVEDELDRTPQLTGNAGAARVHGIGRPSIVDLENHRYREDLPSP